MKKMWLVAKREYRYNVRRKGFIIATLSMPLIFALLGLISGGTAVLARRQTNARVDNIGVVDDSGILQFQLLPALQRITAPVNTGLGPLARKAAEAASAGSQVNLTKFDSADSARAAFLRKEIRGYYIIPRDYIQSGKVELSLRRGALMASSQPGWDILRRLMAASLVEGKLQEETAKRVWAPPALTLQTLKDDGSEDKAGELGEVTTFVVPYVFGFLFIISIMASSGYLLQGVAEEKENRVIEVLLSSVTQNELLAGKVLGLCAVGLTQMCIWALMGVVPALYFLPELELRWSQLFVTLLFFLLGFVLFGTLMAGFGSLGNNFRESQQTAMLVSLSSVVPLFFQVAILAQPNGTLARVLTFIPLTAPLTVVLRIGATRVAWWEILLSAAILFASLFFFIRMAAKLFRLGTLMYGKRPSAIEIARWLREA